MSHLVSVIVPLYNYSKYITWCMQSVLNQEYDNIELIVVDDCSTDNSFEVASIFARTHSNTKVIKTEVNSGYSKAKNEGIAASRGEYIVTLDADDMLTKESVQPRLAAILKHKAGLVHARALNIGAKMSLADCYGMSKQKRQKPKIHAQTVMMARWVYQKYGLYDENLRSRSDKEMWWRLFGDGCEGPHHIKKVYIKHDVAYYRIHPASMMRFRRKHPKYNKKIKRLLMAAYRMRQKEGVTEKNTRFLKT